MPQLDPTFFATQLFWLAVTFLALYVVLWRVSLPRVAGVLEARQNRLDDDLDKAKARREEAEGVLAEYERLLAEAHGEAQGVLRENHEKMAEEATRRQQELAQRVAEQTREAEARIEKAKAAALKNIRAVAAEAAGAATERLIGVKVDGGEVARVLDEVAGGKA